MAVALLAVEGVMSALIISTNDLTSCVMGSSAVHHVLHYCQGILAGLRSGGGSRFRGGGHGALLSRV